MSKKKETKVQKKPAKKTVSKKDLIKKTVAKQAAKKQAVRPVRAEITVRVDTTPQVPTETALMEPMKDGQKMTVPKTWLSEAQLVRMVQRTPSAHVYKRKGRGGQEFDYVTGAYVEKVLNFVFGWNWDFEIIEHGVAGHFIWVKGALTVRGDKPGQSIRKTQFGRAEIKYLREKPRTPENYVDFGNDLKAAATDSLKKCASLLGIASDIYGKSDYKAETGKAPLPELPPQSHPEEVSIAPGAPSPKPAFEDHVCQSLAKGGCGKDLTKQEAEFSKRQYGRELCREHFPKNR